MGSIFMQYHAGPPRSVAEVLNELSGAKEELYTVQNVQRFHTVRQIKYSFKVHIKYNRNYNLQFFRIRVRCSELERHL